MPREKLALEALPAWMRLNDVTLFDVNIDFVPAKGCGLIADKMLKRVEETADVPHLITVPHELILNAEAVELYAKQDKNFRQLLDACGHKSPRHDILLFLFVQLVLTLRSPGKVVGTLNAWTEYIKFLSESVPVPTMWNDRERILLRGTSLEPALNAKLEALTHEFDEFRDKSSGIECWDDAIWDNGEFGLTHWLLVDAWYRSRVLELPRGGPSLVPCLDMVNHSRAANAYYDENSKDEAVLLLRLGSKTKEGGEITIDYGEDKPAAEFLFSYGFIDAGSPAQTMVLPLHPLEDDPLRKAKAYVFEDAPTVVIKDTGGSVMWRSNFAYLACVNEEDGLEFKLLQETDGSTQLKMFWQDEDVTDKAKEFPSLVSGHHLSDVIQLRVVMVILGHLQEQLERLEDPVPFSTLEDAIPFGIMRSNFLNALELRRVEHGLLEEAIAALEEQRNYLMSLENVTTYLGKMEVAESSLADNTASNEGDESEDDFS